MRRAGSLTLLITMNLEMSLSRLNLQNKWKTLQKIPPRPPVEGVWVVISGGEFFGRILKHISIRVEVDDLGLADLGVQVVTCQRMKTDLVEEIPGSLFDSWRERHSDDDNNETCGVFSVTALRLAVIQGSAKVMRVCCLFNETRRCRSVGATGSRFQGSPRTTKWLVKKIAKSGGEPLQHQRWKTQLRVDDGDRSVHGHELLCTTLELSGCYDQLDLSALAGIELVGRRLQLIEESKSAGGSAAYEGAKFFVGYRRSGIGGT